jgi:DNA-binding NarL/FixJ family response regulator
MCTTAVSPPAEEEPLTALTVANPALRLLLVDDHTIVREGLKRVLDPPGSGWALTEAVTGFEALEILRADVRVLVLSMHAEEQYALRAFKAGADGYVTKDIAATELVRAVRRVASGGCYVTESLAEQVVRQLNGPGDAPLHTRLTDRELDVLQRIAAGHRLTEIGDELHLSVKTVSSHKTRIQEKLHVSNSAELVRYAFENRIADPLGSTAPPDRPA